MADYGFHLGVVFKTAIRIVAAVFGLLIIGIIAALFTGCAFSTANYRDAELDENGYVTTAGHLKHTTLTFFAEQDSQGSIDFQQGVKGTDDFMSILLNSKSKQDSTTALDALIALGGIVAASQGLSPAVPVAAIAAPVVESIATRPAPTVSRETLDSLPRLIEDAPEPSP